MPESLKSWPDGLSCCADEKESLRAEIRRLRSALELIAADSLRLPLMVYARDVLEGKDPCETY